MSNEGDDKGKRGLFRRARPSAESREPVRNSTDRALPKTVEPKVVEPKRSGDMFARRSRDDSWSSSAWDDDGWDDDFSDRSRRSSIRPAAEPKPADVDAWLTSDKDNFDDITRDIAVKWSGKGASNAASSNAASSTGVTSAGVTWDDEVADAQVVEAEFEVDRSLESLSTPDRPLLPAAGSGWDDRWDSALQPETDETTLQPEVDSPTAAQTVESFDAEMPTIADDVVEAVYDEPLFLHEPLLQEEPALNEEPAPDDSIFDDVHTDTKPLVADEEFADIEREVRGEEVADFGEPTASATPATFEEILEQFQLVDAPVTNPATVLLTPEGTGRSLPNAEPFDTHVPTAVEEPIAEIPIAEIPIAEMPATEMPIAEAPTTAMPADEFHADEEVFISELPIAEEVPHDEHLRRDHIVERHLPDGERDYFLEDLYAELDDDVPERAVSATPDVELVSQDQAIHEVETPVAEEFVSPQPDDEPPVVEKSRTEEVFAEANPAKELLHDESPLETELFAPTHAVAGTLVATVPGGTWTDEEDDHLTDHLPDDFVGEADRHGVEKNLVDQNETPDEIIAPAPTPIVTPQVRPASTNRSVRHNLDQPKLDQPKLDQHKLDQHKEEDDDVFPVRRFNRTPSPTLHDQDLRENERRSVRSAGSRQRHPTATKAPLPFSRDTGLLTNIGFGLVAVTALRMMAAVGSALAGTTADQGGSLDAGHRIGDAFARMGTTHGALLAIGVGVLALPFVLHGKPTDASATKTGIGLGVALIAAIAGIAGGFLALRLDLRSLDLTSNATSAATVLQNASGLLATCGTSLVAILAALWTLSLTNEDDRY